MSVFDQFTSIPDTHADPLDGNTSHSAAPSGITPAPHRGVKPLAGFIAAALAFVVTGCGPSAPEAFTLAYTATSNEPAPATENFRDLLTEHAAAALSPGDGTVTVVTDGAEAHFDMTPMRGDDVETDLGKVATQIESKLSDLNVMSDKLASTEAGLDVVGVLDRALVATKTGGTVVMITSGFSTVAPLDLTAAGDWMSAPTALTDAIAEADLPDATGKNITFAGLGYPDPASAQQIAGPAARSALTTIMTRLCERMNAESCTVLDGRTGSGAPVATIDVAAVDLNQIVTHCVGQVDIDTQLAFEPWSSSLLPEADTQLEPLAEALSRCRTGTVVDAIGHSALLPGSDGASGSDLEQRRAAAVLDRLHELGAPTSTRGSASAGGQVVDNVPGGVYREDLAIRNRVVTLSLTPTT